MKKRSREKINWLFAINDFGLTQSFEDYQAEHSALRKYRGLKPISKNRLARAYFLHFQRLIGLDFTSLYVSGSERTLKDYYSTIGKPEIYSKLIDHVSHFRF